MKTILKRLEHLEHARQTLIAERSTDSRALLMERLNRLGERMRASGNWPPENMPTVEKVTQRVQALVASYRERR